MEELSAHATPIVTRPFILLKKGGGVTLWKRHILVFRK